jgi:hypothetical protein
MKEVDRVVDEVQRASCGDAWHGCALKEILKGVDASMAAAKPLASAHSIWEIVLHITAWAREVARRLSGAAPGQPVEGDSPAVVATSPQAWETAQLVQHDAYHAGQIALLKKAQVRTAEAQSR